jgi:hypothetical protein
MNAVGFLLQLRDAGITIDYQGNRLIVEAPTGAVTAELRAELVMRKAELIAALENAREHVRDDPRVNVARGEIAALLAFAYRRYATIPRVGDDEANSGKHELANSAGSSVHGVVP